MTVGVGVRVRLRVRVYGYKLRGNSRIFEFFFDISFDRLHFSKYTDQCVRINFPKDF